MSNVAIDVKVNMRDLLAILSFIWNHPLNNGYRLLSIINFFRWQFGQILLNNKKIIVPWLGDSKILVGKGETGLTGNIYAGLMEFPDMAFLVHCLRDADLFLDVGANVGAYTILSSKVVGAESIAFEPIAETVERLKDQLAINRIFDIVDVRNVGVGNQHGYLAFTNNQDTINKVSLNNKAESTTKVEVVRLDDEVNINRPTMLKIDVEGFEFNVLDGAKRILSNQNVLGLIIELNGSGNEYGYTNEQIHEKIINNGFTSYSYNPFSRALSELNDYNKNGGNTIYVRDIELIRLRCKSAPLRILHTANGIAI